MKKFVDGKLVTMSATELKAWQEEQAATVRDPYPPLPVPSLFATASMSIQNGQLGSFELASQLQGAIYEDGWLMVMFAEPQQAANYLVFAQTDIPARVDQYKDNGAFELLFSNSTSGDPVEPGRVDLQILRVR